MDPEQAGRLLALPAPEGEDVVERPGEALLEEGRLLRPEGLPVDLDELGHAEEAVERDLEAPARPARDPVERDHDLLEQALVEGEVPALGAERDEVDEDLDAAAADPLLAEGPDAALGLAERGALVGPVEVAVVEGLDADLQPQGRRGEIPFGESGHSQDHGLCSLVPARAHAARRPSPKRARAMPWALRAEPTVRLSAMAQIQKLRALAGSFLICPMWILSFPGDRRRRERWPRPPAAGQAETVVLPERGPDLGERGVAPELDVGHDRVGVEDGRQDDESATGGPPPGRGPAGPRRRPGSRGPRSRSASGLPARASRLKATWSRKIRLVMAELPSMA